MQAHRRHDIFDRIWEILKHAFLDAKGVLVVLPVIIVCL